MTAGQELFDEFNARYFRGRLPRYRVRFDDFSLERLGWQGEVLPERRVIRIRKQLPKGTNLERVLLHEMCHIGAWGHGPRFRENLRRLADQGEEWALEEIANYEKAPTWNQEMANLRGKLDEAADVNPRPSFPRVLAFLAADLGMSAAELRRMAPWIRAAWATARRSADSLAAVRRRYSEREK